MVGVVNSQATGVSQPFDSSLGLVGRVVFIPFKSDDGMLQVGVHGSYVARPADVGGPDTAPGAARYTVTLQERPELRVDGTRLISTARSAPSTPKPAASRPPPSTRACSSSGVRALRHRAAQSGDAVGPHFSGAYVEGSWVVTGERRRFNPGNFTFDAPLVDHPFSVADRSWGALEIADAIPTPT